MPSAARLLQQSFREAIGAPESLDAVTEAAATVLGPRLGAVLTVWSTTDPADLLGTSCRLFDADLRPLPIGPAELARERALFELEWLDTDPNTFAAMRRHRRRAAGLRADVRDLSTVERFERILQPLGTVDELRALLSDGDEVWGTAILYRGDRAFEPAEIALLGQCTAALAQAVRHAMLARAADHPALDVPPGSVVLDRHDHPVVTSPAAEDLLARLDESHARTALVAVAAETRIRGAGRSTVVGRDGAIALHAAPAKGIDDGVSVVVERPRPAQLAPLILRAYGFTRREREIAELVLQGFTRKAIARRCRIAEDTVDDHLEQIYRKAGVPGRAALSAAIFERFYQPHRHHAEPGPYGWFSLPDAAAAREQPATS